MRPRRLALALLAVSCLSGGRSALAIIIITNAPDANGAPYTVYQSTPPTAGPFANSGAQYEGTFAVPFGTFVGTAIAPDYFLTSSHVAPAVGAIFHYQGAGYSVLSDQDVGNGMTVVKVSGTFGSYAPLYGGSQASTVGQDVSLFGLGENVNVNAPLSGPDGKIQGYQAGSLPGMLTWGASQIASQGAQNGTNFLYGFFSPVAPYSNIGQSAFLLPGDSGGGEFINVNGRWELVGVNYGSTYNVTKTSTGAQYSAALFDLNGYTPSGGAAVTTNFPSEFADSSVPASYGAIVAITGVPEPGALTLLGGGLGLALAFGRSKRRGAVVAAGRDAT